jgi:major membrane immunogen (membrane-anchored lipoprotein)
LYDQLDNNAAVKEAKMRKQRAANAAFRATVQKAHAELRVQKAHAEQLSTISGATASEEETKMHAALERDREEITGRFRC